MQEVFESEQVQDRTERRDARETRRLLLEVTKRLFAEQGIAATTMKQVASAAGVGKGTLYRHFADKGELGRTTSREDVTEFQEQVGEQLSYLQQISSAVKRLESLIAERIRLPPFTAIEEVAHGVEAQARRFCGPFTA